MTNPSDLMAPAREAMRIALEIVYRMSPGTLIPKGDRDMASEVDIEIEDRIRAFLSRETPEVGFLGEEHGGAELGGPVWVLDPVDGTVNYVHGLPIFAVSLGLVEKDQSILGRVSMPALDLHYSASLGNGARRNGEAIRVSSTTNIEEALVSFGDFAVGPGAGEANAKRLELVARLAKTVERIRMVGSAAADLVWLADGRLDACLLPSNRPWDVAAGTVIARESGAVVTNLASDGHRLSVPGTVAAPEQIWDRIREILDSDYQ